jgi:hypothetical protein
VEAAGAVIFLQDLQMVDLVDLVVAVVVKMEADLLDQALQVKEVMVEQDLVLMQVAEVEHHKQVIQEDNALAVMELHQA